MPDGSGLLPFLIHAFVRSSADQLRAIRHAVACQDAELLRETAHELTGVSANLGANQMATLCGELELAARVKDLGPAEDVLTRLEPEISRVQAALQEYAGTPG
jgi:HPt (histidine-containing phosphotransfer) domain-containing protein